MRIRPCIDIHDGKVKQIVGGSLRDSGASENFVTDCNADYYAELYREKGLPGGHIILLNSASSDPEHYEADRQQALLALRAYPGGMQIGGGVTAENAAAYLDAGASHVIVTSYVFRDGQLDQKRLNRLLQSVGREHLVLDLSCRKQRDGSYAVVTDRWQKLTQLRIGETVLDELAGQCDEFLIHAADVEGKRSGIETDLVSMLGSWQMTRRKRGEEAFPVTYAGGVHTYEDLKVIHRLSDGSIDVTVGSALDLFGGDLSLDQLAKACI
jgi:phosphoribosylformimino-5-aminoimidazole carboxamide ribotide isomerase